MQLAAADREIATVDQALAEAEAAREIVITAPEDGTITGLSAVSGSSIGTDAPLMTLVPAGAPLEARLYGPSRAIGFVRPGQRVRLRYQAFPHQKFGQYGGVVASVSRSTVEATPGGDGPPLPGLEPGEPAYRVTVTLDRPSVTAYGETVPLQPGMQLEADVLIESRRLYRWVLDPLHSLTGGGA
jgi:membrane fusion protein